MKNENIAFISDTHAPYHHPDALRFIKAVGDVYDIDVWKHTGDLVDHHWSSFHEVEFGTLSPEEEMKGATKFCHQLNDIVEGNLTVVIGNHDKIPLRKAKAAGLASETIRSYNDIYGVDWDWKDKDYFDIANGQHCLLTHSISSSTKNNASKYSHCSVQGHYHGEAAVQYASDTELLRWSMTVGCLIDHHSKAFDYASKIILKRPILSMGVLLGGHVPVVVPMVLKKNGRWNGIL